LPYTVERVFLGWDRPLLPAAAAHLIDHYIEGSVADLRAATLVLPGGRARRRLIELLLDEADARGATLVPPRATALGQLPELLLARRKSIASETASLRAWSRALRGVDREALEAVLPHLPEGDDMAAWDKLAALLAGLHKSLAGEGHRFGDVVRTCSSGLPFDDGARWMALEQVQRRYLYVLDQAGLADPYEVRMGALESGAVSFNGDLWLVSVVDMPAVTRRLVEASNATVRTLIHAPDKDSRTGGDATRRFDELGLPVTEYWEAAPVPVADETLWVVERPVDQADAVVAGLEDLGGKVTADDVVLVVHPDSEVVPYLEQRLEAHGVAGRYAAGTPLSHTAPVRLLQAVADFLDDGSFEALAALLRHPDAEPLFGDRPETASDPLSAADRYFTEHLPSTVTGALPSGRGRTSAFLALAEALQRKGPLRELRGRKPLSEWMPQVLDVVLACYGGLDWDRSRPTHRRLLDVLGRLQFAAASLSALPAALDEACRCGAAIRALVQELRDEALPPEANRNAVELLDWLELPLDDAPHVMLTGFNEGSLPESVSGHPFLPDALRTLLGLTDNRRRLARDSYRLITVLKSKTSLRLVSGRRSAKGDPLLPSRLMFRIPETQLPARVLEFLNKGGDPGQSPTSEATLAALDLAPGARSDFLMPPEPVIELPFEEVPTQLAVTGFKTVLSDPYRFALEKIRRVRSLHDEARELDPLQFGSLAHRVLQAFGKAALESPPTVDVCDAESVETKLMTLLSNEAVTTFGETTMPAVFLQVEQLRARFRAFAMKQAEWAAAGWRIVAVECMPTGDGMPFEVDGTPFLLRGQIDRIDHNPETDEWAVLDYKTGNAVDPPEETHRKKRDGEVAWIDLQLPLYRRLLPGIMNADGTRVVEDTALQRGAVRVGYVSLPRKTQDTAFMLADWSEEDLATAEETAREVIRFLRVGRFEFDAAVTKIIRWGRDPLEPLITMGWQSAGDERDGPGPDPNGDGPNASEEHR
jgi:ATP-dependent helicase/nuclease subunit B